MRTGFIAAGVALILVTLSGCATPASSGTAMPSGGMMAGQSGMGGMMGTYGSYSSAQTGNGSGGSNASTSDSPNAKQHVHLTTYLA